MTDRFVTAAPPRAAALMSLLAATLPVAAGDATVNVTSYCLVTRHLLAAALLRLAAALPHARPHAAAADPPHP